jgi:hypothetical protein
MTVRRAAQGGDDVGTEMLQVPQPPPPAPPPDEPTTLASVAEDPQGQQQSSDRLRARPAPGRLARRRSLTRRPSQSGSAVARTPSGSGGGGDEDAEEPALRVSSGGEGEGPEGSPDDSAPPAVDPAVLKSQLKSQLDFRGSFGGRFRGAPPVGVGAGAPEPGQYNLASLGNGGALPGHAPLWRRGAGPPRARREAPLNSRHARRAAPPPSPPLVLSGHAASLTPY